MMNKLKVVAKVCLVLSGVITALAYDVPLLADKQSYAVPGVTCNFSPFNSHHEVVRMQSFYKASELKAAGILPNEPITAIGWKFATKNAQQNYAAPALNNVQVAYAWLEATSVVLQVWGKKTGTFSYAAGLNVATKTSISTILLPSAGQRKFVELTTPLRWDGTKGLLLEFSMDNSDGTTSILDRNCVAFKFAEASTTSTIFGERARTAYAYIYYDSCWHGMGYPWSTVSYSTCPYASQSMSASGMSGVVMDVAFRTAQISTTSTAATVRTTPSSTAISSSTSGSQSVVSSSSSSADTASTSLSSSLVTSSQSDTPSHITPSQSTTVEAQTSSPPPASNHNHSTKPTLAIAFAVVFAIIACALAVIVCVLWRKFKQNSTKKDSVSVTNYGNLVNEGHEVNPTDTVALESNSNSNTNTVNTSATVDDGYLVVERNTTTVYDNSDNESNENPHMHDSNDTDTNRMLSSTHA
eukprot:m.132749 g.132749  ORF g.132749 m.132749 type:complete len:469 (-) comp29629_c0_seq1:389-1795(-)